MVARERQHLREHERAFRRLTENATEVFWIVDPDRNETVYVNPAFEEVWGRPRERIYEDRERLIESFHPEDRARMKRAMEGKIETGEFDETYRILRPDGEVRWIHDRGFPVHGSEGELVNVAGVATDITDRKRIKAELRRQRDRIERIVETTPVMLLVMDASRTITFANARAAELAGVDDISGTPFEEFPWELLRTDDSPGERPDDRPWPDGWEPVPGGERPFAIVEERGEPIYDLQYPAWIGGEFRWLSINGAPLYDGDEFAGAVFATEDITERKRREEALTGLHETSRTMMRAESPEEIYEVAVAAASDLLSFPKVACYRLEPDGYALEPAAHSPEAERFVEEHDRIEEGDPIWGAFVDESVEREEAVTAIPLGSHGVLVFVGEIGGSFSLARVLCDNAEAALDRTDHESVLRAQSEALRRTNAELERLNHVTDLVRDVTGALVRATSREEIATTVCERLAAADLYRFAWIGDDTGDPTAWAGITESTLAGLDRSEAGYEPPAERALRTGEPAIDGNLLDTAHPDRRADALSEGYRSVAAVPLSHRDRIYGVLSVYANRDDAFGGDEREVLSELGRTVGYAIDAVETRTELASDGIIELRFAIDDPGTLPVRLASGAHLEHRGVVPHADGSIRWFVAIDAPIDRVESAAADVEHVETVRPIVTEGATLIECVVHPPCLLSPFVERGATITDLAVSDGGTTLTAEAVEADVRAISETLESRYGAELIGRRDRNRPPRTREERLSEVTGELTDRQREILEIAHRSGYFETPRKITGAELAERLGINRSTFHRTLRAAEQSTFEALLR